MLLIFAVEVIIYHIDNVVDFVAQVAWAGNDFMLLFFWSSDCLLLFFFSSFNDNESPLRGREGDEAAAL